MKLAHKIFLTGILASTLAFSNVILDSTLLPRILLFAITALLTFFLLARQKTNVQATLPVILYTCFCVLNLIGITYSVSKSEAFFETGKVLLGFFCFILTIQLLKTDKNFILLYLQRLSIILVIIGGLALLWQSKFYNPGQKDALYVFSGINGHKNLFASFLFLNACFLFLKTIETSKVFKYLRFASIAITILILAIIRTKAVYIGSAAALVLYLTVYFFSKREIRIKHLITLSLAALVTLNVFMLVAAPKIIERTLTYNIQLSPVERQQKELDNERVMLWHKTYGVFKKHFLLGVGPGNWQIHFPNETLKGMWRAEDLNFTFQRPHNDLLWILSETGMAGFNLYFLMIILILIAALGAVRTSASPQILLICVSFIPAFFVISFFDFPKERMEHILFFNLTLAITYHHTRPESFGRIFEIKPTRLYAGFVVSACVLILTIYRIKGELHLRELYRAKYKGETGNVLIHSKKAYNTFYSLDPTSVPLKWYSGNAHAENMNFEKAFLDLKQAHRDNPYNRNVLNDLGSAYAKLGRTDSAKALYLEAARISPRFDDAKLNLTALYIREQDFKAADSVLQTLLHDSPRRTQYQSMVNTLLGSQN